MPKGPKGEKRPADVIGAAVMIGRIATGEVEDNHCAALALYFFHYNFCRIHKTLRTSPAQAAGITDELLSMESLCALMDVANPPKKRGPYKKAVV